jgi:hypothetical protein
MKLSNKFPLHVLLMAIEPPTFDVDGITLNEYELRALMAQVAKGEIPHEMITSITSNQSGIELGIREDGMLANDCDSLNLNTKFTLELLKAQTCKED